MDSQTYIEITSSILRELASAATENVRFGMWSDLHARDHLRRTMSGLKKFYSKNLPLPLPTMLTLEQLQQVGFAPHENGVFLMPLWLLDFTDQEIEVESIFGDKRLLGKVDDEARMGLLAWGFRRVAQNTSRDGGG